jgi:hypothetical protein
MVEIEDMDAWHEAIRNNPALLEQIKQLREKWNAERDSSITEEAKKPDAWYLFRQLARTVYDALPNATAEGWSSIEQRAISALKRGVNSDAPEINFYLHMYELVRLAYFEKQDTREENLPLEHELQDLKTTVEHYFRTNF